MVALACGLGGAFVYERFLAPAPEARVESTRAPEGGSKPVVETTTVSAADRHDLADRIDAIAQRMDKLQRQIDDRAKSVPPEIAALQVRIADLTDTTNTLSPLASRVDHLTNRVSELSSTLTTLRTDVTSFQSRYLPTTRLASTSSTLREAPAPPPETAPSSSTPPSTTPTPLPDHRGRSDGGNSSADPKALSEGTELFRRGRYKDALDVFDKLEIRNPDDARVWYYAALCYGFSTKDWTDGAVRLVEKGIAREEAGTPSTSEIDAGFKDLTPANGKDWLTAYRNRVVNPKKQ